jgi:hypothetical protein
MRKLTSRTAENNFLVNIAVYINAAIEVEVASIRAANCITPIVAVGTDIVERTIAVVAVARHGQ